MTEPLPRTLDTCAITSYMEEANKNGQRVLCKMESGVTAYRMEDENVQFKGMLENMDIWRTKN